MYLNDKGMLSGQSEKNLHTKEMADTIAITQLTENIESAWLLAGTKKLKKAIFRGAKTKPCSINETDLETMSHTV